MKAASLPMDIVRAGNRTGLGSVYSSTGQLIIHQGESTLREAYGWDINARSPWRRVLPQLIFSGFSGDVMSRLFITTERIVLVREIDTWRELRGELTPLGIPSAAAKQAELSALKAAGVRQFCEIWPAHLCVVNSRRFTRSSSWLGLKLVGDDGRQYAISLWKTSGIDNETLSMIDSRFPRTSK